MKLKKPAKDHRGEWDLVLDNEGTTVAALKITDKSLDWPEWVNAGMRILWATPSYEVGPEHFSTYKMYWGSGVAFFRSLGVDTAPLEKLMEEKNGS